MFEKYSDLVNKINVKAIRDEKKALNEKKTKVIKSYTKKLIKQADENKDLLTKEIFRLLLEKYENNPFEITNSNKEWPTQISITLVEKRICPLEREKELIYKYNKTIDENSAENKVYFHAIENNGIKKWIPVKLDFTKIKKMDLFDKIECDDNDDIRLSADIEKIRNLTIKAHNNELDIKLFDKEIVDMLNNSYVKMKEKKEKINTFIKKMKSTYVKKVYLDIIKGLINDYKNNPYTNKNYIIFTLHKPNKYNHMPNEYEFYTKIINYYLFHTYDKKIICYPIIQEDTITPKIKYYPFIIQDLFNLLYENFKSVQIDNRNGQNITQVRISVNTTELEDYIISIQEAKQKKLIRERKNSS